MSAPLHFATQAAFEQAIGSYLKANLSFSVSSDTETVDVGYGDYQERRRHRVEVQLGDETIADFSLD